MFWTCEPPLRPKSRAKSSTADHCNPLCVPTGRKLRPARARRDLQKAWHFSAQDDPRRRLSRPAPAHSVGTRQFTVSRKLLIARPNSSPFTTHRKLRSGQGKVAHHRAVLVPSLRGPEIHAHTISV